MGTIAAQVGTIAIGVTFLMISGEFDLSVGSVFLMGNWIFATLINMKLDPILTVIVTATVCTLMGLLNGLITVRLHIPSFITTLGTMMGWRGLVYYLTEGRPVYIEISGYTQAIMNALSGYVPGTSVRVTAIWLFCATIILSIVLTKTRYGKWTIATGGNLAAARSMGVNTDRVKLINFSVVGLLAGLSGIFTISFYMAVLPDVGTGFELDAICATVLGGTLLVGGYGTIIGTLIGSFLMSEVSSGLILAGAPSYLYVGLTGLILILAVVSNQYVRRRLVRAG